MTVPVLSFRPGDGITVDLERMVASRALLQANSGGGKSFMLRYILEQTHGRIQQIVLDPEGEFSTLREKFDYLLAGKEGDVPAEPKTAKVLARRLLELGASAVIDLYDLSLDDRRRFVRLFLEELMHLPRSLWRPLLVVVDEAHVFAPEQGSAESLAAVVTLCTQGRKRGFSALLATQRLSKLHKDAAAELLNVLIGRTGLDVDVKRAGDVLGFDKEKRLTLRDLEPGLFYAFGPAIAREVTLVRSGKITTTHPEPGKIAPPAPPPPAAVRKLVAQLQDLAAQAKQEALTIEEKDQEIVRLKREVSGLRRQTPASVGTVDDKAVARAVAAAEKPLRDVIARLNRERDTAVAQYDRVFKKHNDDLGKYFGKLQVMSSQLFSAIEAGAPGPLTLDFNRSASSIIDVQKSEVPRTAPRAASAPRVNSNVNSPSSLKAPQQKILNALATYEGFGYDQVERDAAAAMATYKPGSGHVNNVVGELTSLGLVTIPQPGFLQLTPEGRKLAQARDVASLDDVHEIWLSLLNGPQQKFLRVLIETRGDIARDELAERAGYTPGSGHVNNVVGELTSLKAAVIPRKGFVAPSKLLFPEGLE